MILLAALLSFAWPTPRTEFGPFRAPEPGWTLKHVPHCCGSMRPILNGGELVYVSAVKPGEKLVGQIVSNGTALHLVTAETAGAVRTTGVNNRQSDDWMPRARLEYVLRYVVRP